MDLCGQVWVGVVVRWVEFAGGVADSASLDLTSAVTLEAWVYPAVAQSGWRAVVQKETDSYLLHASSGAGGLRPAAGVTVGAAVPTVFSPSALPVGRGRIWR